MVSVRCRFHLVLLGRVLAPVRKFDIKFNTLKHWRTYLVKE